MLKEKMLDTFARIQFKLGIWLKSKLIFLAIIVFSFAIFSAFIKPLIRLSDYRDAYVGTYSCSSLCQAVNSEHTGLSISTDTITIGVGKDPLDSILQISIRTNTFKVKLKGTTLTAYPAGQHWGGAFYATDSLGFVISYSLAQIQRQEELIIH
jgi:hypothetical protein